MACEWRVNLAGCKMYSTKAYKKKMSQEMHLFQHVCHTLKSLH